MNSNTELAPSAICIAQAESLPPRALYAVGDDPNQVIYRSFVLGQVADFATMFEHYEPVGDWVDVI